MSDFHLNKVTFYKNGLAFVERTANLKAKTKAKLDINEKVKNLVISTLNIESSVPCNVNYDYSPPLSVDPDDDKPIFNFAIGGSQSHGSFLTSIVGAEIVLTTNDVGEGVPPIEGFVLSVNQVSNQIGTTEKLQSEYESCQILTYSGSMISVNISTIKSIKLVDQTLQKELMRSLRHRIASRLKNTKKKKERCKNNCSSSIGYK